MMKKGVHIATEKRKERHQVAASDCRLCGPTDNSAQFFRMKYVYEKKIAYTYIEADSHIHIH